MVDIKKYESDLSKLIRLGVRLAAGLRDRIEDAGKTRGHGDSHNEQTKEEPTIVFETHYQGWYTEAYALIKQLLPDRLEEFKELYMGRGNSDPTDSRDYNIQHWLRGIRSPQINDGYAREKRLFQDIEIAGLRTQSQVQILRSVRGIFKSSLFDIRQMVQADIFDSELEAASALSKQGFTRAAGSVAGVVLEKHLSQVVTNHNLTINKQNPTISDFNNALKDNSTLDIPTWRQILRLGDIRNLCSHNKDRDPTKEEVDELINGVDKYTKTLF